MAGTALADQPGSVRPGTERLQRGPRPSLYSAEVVQWRDGLCWHHPVSAAGDWPAQH